MSSEAPTTQPTLEQQLEEREADIREFITGVEALLQGFQTTDSEGNTSVSFRKITKTLMSLTNGDSLTLPGMDKILPIYKKYQNF